MNVRRLTATVLLWSAARIALCVLALGGCRKARLFEVLPPPAADTDTLWAMAPEGVSMGIVAAPGAIGTFHRGLVQLANAASAARLDLGPTINGWLAQSPTLAGALVTPDGLGLFGLDPARGGALFVAGTEAYLIIPVADRKTFVSAVGGIEGDDIDVLASDVFCDPGPRWYRCASSEARLRSWTPAARSISRTRQVARGELELYIFQSSLPDRLKSRLPPGGVGWLSLTSRRGELIADAAIARAIEDEALPLDLEVAPTTTGFLRFNGQGALEALRLLAPDALDRPLAPRVTWRSLVDSLNGELLIETAAGHGARARIELGGRRPSAAVGRGCELRRPAAIRARAGERAREVERGCAGTLELEPLAGPIAVSLTVGDRSAVIEIGASTDAPPVATSPPAESLESTAAIWIRGAMFEWARPNRMSLEPKALGLWALSQLSELELDIGGTAETMTIRGRVATTWRNPPEVSSALEPLIARLGDEPETALSEIARLAAEHPESPLATDMALGSSSGLIAIGLALALQRLGGPGPQTLAEERAAMFALIVDAMCKCADRACVTRVEVAYDDWTDRYSLFKPPAGESAALIEAANRYAACKAAALR